MRWWLPCATPYAERMKKAPGSLLRATLTLLAGGALAQALPLLLGPWLTRLYSPDEFGQFAMVWTLAVNVAVVGCARYEFALPLEAEEGQAGLLAGPVPAHPAGRLPQLLPAGPVADAVARPDPGLAAALGRVGRRRDASPEPVGKPRAALHPAGLRAGAAIRRRCPAAAADGPGADGGDRAAAGPHPGRPGHRAAAGPPGAAGGLGEPVGHAGRWLEGHGPAPPRFPPAQHAARLCRRAAGQPGPAPDHGLERRCGGRLLGPCPALSEGAGQPDRRRPVAGPLSAPGGGPQRWRRPGTSCARPWPC